MASARRLVTARPWLSVVVVVAIVAAAVLGYRRWWGTGSGTASSATGVNSRLVAVSTGTVREAVSTTGTFAPADEEDLSFASSAVITSVRVTQGQKVEKGQILGTIDTLALESTLAQARAQLATAQSTLASAQDDDTTTAAQLAADKATVTTARTAVTSAQAALAAAVLRAPIAGTVAEVNVAKGDTASGSAGSGSSGLGGSSSSGSSGGAGASSRGAGSSGSGQTTTTASSSSADFVLIGMKKWTVTAAVDDTQVGLIAKGDQVQLTTDNVSDTVFGLVSSVSVLSSSSSGSASYPVTIAVTGTPTGLHDGAAATASIIYKQVTGVLTVPSTAVHSDESTSYVYVSKNGARTKTTVATGLSSGGTTQITSGLTSGEQVYVETAVGGPRGTGTGSGSARNGTGYGGYGRGNFGGGAGNFGGGAGNFPGGGTGNFPGGAGNLPAGGNAPGGGR